jgi:hypothetical protein
MQLTDQALDLSRAHAQAAGQAARVMTTCISAMFEASTAFAKSGSERNIAMAATLLSAKSPESAAELQRAFVRNSMQAASIMARRIADACAAAAKQCDALAAQSMEAATKCSAMSEKTNP